MKFEARLPAGKYQRFVIELDRHVGFYLYVFEGERCVYDYLQDTLEIVMDQAFEQFQVPRDAWNRIDDDAR